MLPSFGPSTNIQISIVKITWNYVVQSLDLALGFLLIMRLLSLKLHGVYARFCFLLLADLLGSFLWFLLHATRFKVDYRVVWLVDRTIVWGLTLWTVYGLFGAILANLPGIAKLSHKVLNLAFTSCLIVGLASAYFEYGAIGLGSNKVVIAKLSAVGIILERAISSVSLLILLAMLCFLLWFPVVMSKNLAVFTVGFMVYFGAKIFLMLTRGSWSHEALQIMTLSIGVLSCLCFACWLVLLNTQGERIPGRISISRDMTREQQLVRQLELMDRSLAR